MDPKSVSNSLRHIASKIDASTNPNKKAVLRDIRVLLAALSTPSGVPAGWKMYDSKKFEAAPGEMGLTPWPVKFTTADDKDNPNGIYYYDPNWENGDHATRLAISEYLKSPDTAVIVMDEGGVFSSIWSHSWDPAESGNTPTYVVSKTGRPETAKVYKTILDALNACI